VEASIRLFDLIVSAGCESKHLEKAGALRARREVLHVDVYSAQSVRCIVMVAVSQQGVEQHPHPASAPTAICMHAPRVLFISIPWVIFLYELVSKSLDFWIQCEVYYLI
jgi:hypothetical protein